MLLLCYEKEIQNHWRHLIYLEYLRHSNKFYYLESNKIGEKVPRKFYKNKYDYIFCFRSFYIITKKLLKKVRKAPINFHPSPPEFRGAGGINYTLYKRLNFFGSTAHLMSEKIN